MPFALRPVVVALGAGVFAVALASASTTAVFAQANKAAPSAPAAAEPAMKEITLTEKQIQGVLAAHKDVDAIAAKLPDDQDTKPDPKILAQLDDAAKKHGFASYDEYSDVVEAIGMVLAGTDPKTKTYVGPAAALKDQIAAVEADTKMSADDKKQALADLNEAAKNPGPAVTNKTNIDLVLKNYDALSQALEDDE
ncbi:hypothetical protein [Rhodopseudomonas sp. BR0M22]|uniref:hypothetical protein n=1 Tax=Rhodopseudomonas sp. BR0M22 TaxID=2269369 RepID=UPI0013DFB124|nr:hypothetical protein [Rhodopseudomonas sp. BR0M22]MCD0423976.1 hypothetical protein [Rubrivivax sp. JA1024]NEW93086.1 hypothetical protein [Rhodopseudomonas sp. BR0M22]